MARGLRIVSYRAISSRLPTMSEIWCVNGVVPADSDITPSFRDSDLSVYSQGFTHGGGRNLGADSSIPSPCLINRPPSYDAT